LEQALPADGPLSGSFVLPANTAPAWATIAVTVGTSPPSGVTRRVVASSAGSADGHVHFSSQPGAVLGYISFTPNASMTLSALPAFDLHVPASSAPELNIAYNDPDMSASDPWISCGDAPDTGDSVNFTAPATRAMWKAHTTYTFAIAAAEATSGFSSPSDR
jgi:hypothetical protein